MDSARTIYVAQRSPNRGKDLEKPHGKPVPEPLPEEEPAPEPDPEPAPEPAPEPEHAPQPEPESAPDPGLASPLLDAGFENGLDNWNTAGMGDVRPAVVSDIVRDGSHSARFALSGSQNRSELILGGSGSNDTEDAVRFREGDEYWYGFSFYVESMTYGRPGAHNLIMQLKGNDGGSPYFGLQLWDYEGDDGHSGGRGLWSHGEGMDGDRYLAPLAEHSWHDIAIHFKTSSHGTGFYEVYFDGSLIDRRDGASLIPPDATHDYIKDGIYRNGDKIPGSSEIRFDAARLGATRASVEPR